MDDCVFCKIIKGEIPSEKVYEDEDVIAFKDINPVTPIHILVIPKKHIATLLDVTEEDSHLISKIFVAINKIAKQIGIDSGQEVMHIHFHLLAGQKMGSKVV